MCPKNSTQNCLFTAMTPNFCSSTNTKQSLQYTIKTHLGGYPMPKFEANMNDIPLSSMKQSNKSASVYGTAFDYYDPIAISVFCDTLSVPFFSASDSAHFPSSTETVAYVR